MSDSHCSNPGSDIDDSVSEDSHRAEETIYPLNKEVEVPGTDGNVFKTLLVEGTGRRPAKGGKVSVHYVGTLPDGTVFDSSRSRGTVFEFQLNKGEVIKAWDKGVATMKVGEKCLLRCLPKYAYGAEGHPPTIPANSTLNFEVELFSWTRETDISEQKTKTLMKRVLMDGVGYENPSIESKLTIDIQIYAGGSDEKIEALVSQKESEGFSQEQSNQTATEASSALPSLLWEKKGWEVEIGVTVLPPQLVEILYTMRLEELAIFRLTSMYLPSEGCESFNIPPLPLLADPSERYSLMYCIEIHSLSTVKSWDFHGMEKVDQGLVRKNRGNEFFQAGAYDQAVVLYRRALEFVGEDYGFHVESEKKAARELRVILWGNLSQSLLLQREKYPTKPKYESNVKEALGFLQKALEIEPQSVKNLFRLSKALDSRGEWDEAKRTLEKLLQVERENSEALALLEKVKKSIKDYEKTQKSMFSKMFSK